MSDKKLIVLAIGGNSLIKDKGHQTVQDQYATCVETAGHIGGLLQEGHRLVVTHGNGPQVGFILRRAELANTELHMVPLDSCGADSQGAIGYHLQRALYGVMAGWPERMPVATVVTQVVVDRDDPAFAAPSKPIGTFMDETTAMQRKADDGWSIVEDAGRGFRRVVASPQPKAIVELAAIKRLLDGGFVVISVGGGGIPVVEEEDGTLSGAEAVIDKDLASALLANQIGADTLLISTAVEKVCLDFGKPDEKQLDRITAAEAREYIEQGHFAPGSMLPKMQAVLQFIDGGGKEALITDPANLMRAVAGETGTLVVP